MTGLLWAAFGITIGAAVLYAALGLTRPLDRAHLSFACVMALLATYLYFEWELYSANTTAAAVEAVRRQVFAAHAFLGGILVFVPAYTRVRMPRVVVSAAWGALAIVFIANLLAPYGIWFSARPVLIRSTFLGEPYSIVVAPPMSLLQYLHALFVVSLFALTFTCALKLIRHGQRQRGLTLAIALVIVVLHVLVDVVRDAIGGSWPYIAEFGVVSWGLIMSAQLAIDFRGKQQRLQTTLHRAEQHAAELARIVETSLVVRDQLNTPLQTLELDLVMCTAATSEEEEALAEVEGLVVKLAELVRAVEQATNQQSTVTERRP